MHKKSSIKNTTNVTRHERLWLWIIIGTALVASSLPYLYGLLHAGKGYVYLALSPFGPDDTNVYFSMMKQAVQGKVFLESLYTNMPQHGTLFQPLWLVLGWISGLTHLAIPLVFHVARVVFGGIFLVLLYRLLVRPIFSEMRQRILAMLLLAFSSGIGTFFAFTIDTTRDSPQFFLLLPTDQWVPESNTLLTLLHSPLFILSQILLVTILWSFTFLTRRNAVFSAALIGLLAIVHPYDLVTVAAVLPALLIVRMIREDLLARHNVVLVLRTLMIAGFVAIPPILALFVAVAREPAIGIWAQQNVTWSPLPHSYLIGYGLLVPFAVLGWMVWRKSQRPLQLLVLTWVVTSIILLYIPVQVNRRFSNGLHIPLAILATAGVDYSWAWMRVKLRQRQWLRRIILSTLGWLVGLGIFFSSAVTVARSMYWNASPADSFLYISTGEMEAMRWLEKNTPEDAIVLTSFPLSTSIPTITGRRVYVGHKYLAAHWQTRVYEVMHWFFLTNTDDEAKHLFLAQNSITYLVFGPYEARVGKFDPAEKSYLVPAHKDGDVTVYRVLP